MAEIPNLTEMQAAEVRHVIGLLSDDIPMAHTPWGLRSKEDLETALAKFDAAKREEIRKEVIAEYASVIATGYHDDEYGVGMAEAARLLGDLARGGPSPHATHREAVAAQIAEIERPLRALLHGLADFPTIESQQTGDVQVTIPAELWKRIREAGR